MTDADDLKQAIAAASGTVEERVVMKKHPRVEVGPVSTKVAVTKLSSLYTLLQNANEDFIVFAAPGTAVVFTSSGSVNVDKDEKALARVKRFLETGENAL